MREWHTTVTENDFFFSAEVTMVYLVVSFGDLLENYIASERRICSQCTRSHTEPSPGMSIFSCLLQHKQ